MRTASSLDTQQDEIESLEVDFDIHSRILSRSQLPPASVREAEGKTPYSADDAIPSTTAAPTIGSASKFTSGAIGATLEK
jgi:hypothetical protein